MTSSPEPERPQPEADDPDEEFRGFVEVPWVEAEDLELPDRFTPAPGPADAPDSTDDAH